MYRSPRNVFRKTKPLTPQKVYKHEDYYDLSVSSSHYMICFLVCYIKIMVMFSQRFIFIIPWSPTLHGKCRMGCSKSASRELKLLVHKSRFTTSMPLFLLRSQGINWCMNLMNLEILEKGVVTTLNWTNEISTYNNNDDVTKLFLTLNQWAAWLQLQHPVRERNEPLAWYVPLKVNDKQWRLLVLESYYVTATVFACKNQVVD